MQSHRHKQNMTERVRLVTSLQRSFYLSDYWQPGSGEGKAMLKTLSFQQFQFLNHPTAGRRAETGRASDQDC